MSNTYTTSYRLCILSPKSPPGKPRRKVVFDDTSLDLVRRKREASKTYPKETTGIYCVGRTGVWTFVEGVDVTKKPTNTQDGK